MTNRFFNLLLILTFLLCSLVSIGAQTPALSPTPSVQQELAAYIKENYTKREVLIPMRDGARLFTSIYEPKAQTEKYPILLSRTPYTVAPYGEDKFKMSIG
ncbi:MAG: X-Pro dipeptidyl-peptidase, partial [Acidobacteriota bacterium]|nr:X-Pro dipeptidyl-peptidase [Acidobacteriota bacterium]